MIVTSDTDHDLRMALMVAHCLPDDQYGELLVDVDGLDPADAVALVAVNVRTVSPALADKLMEMTR